MNEHVESTKPRLTLLMQCNKIPQGVCANTVNLMQKTLPKVFESKEYATKS